MAPHPRRNLSGVFLAQDQGRGAWRLARSAPHEVSVLIRGAEPDAAQAFGTEPLVDLGLEWHADKALLTFLSGGKVATVAVASAIVHEQLADLYDSLPLANIDASARRFWRRVFTLVRLPGGRFLLTLLSRAGKRR